MYQEQKENQVLFSPQECVKVISGSFIYYPLNCRNEEGLVLFNSLKYLQQNLKENLTSFSAGNQTVVLQMYNDILFYIQSHHSISEGLLRFLLQTIHDIAVFLFGQRFDKSMSKEINEGHRKAYAKHVETFFELCNNDYKYLLIVPDIDTEHVNLEKFIKENNPLAQIPVDPSFVECILFFNHKIIGRYKSKQSSHKNLDQRDLFQLALNERIEFCFPFSTSENVSDNFSKDSIVYKRANLYFNNMVQCCFLSEAQLGENSPFVIALVFKSENPTDEIREQIFQIIKKFIAIIKNFESPPIVPTSFQITGLLHYLLINRTTGRYYEMLKPSVAYPIFTKIQRKMAYIAMMALQSGNYVMFRNHMKFQYTYELKFRKKGNVITPQDKLKIQPGEISYPKIVMDLFPNDVNSIQCFELMTVYLGVMNTKDVIDANKHLFESLVST